MANALAAALASILLTPDARSAGESEWTVWQCWLEQSTRILCRLESAAAHVTAPPEPTPSPRPVQAPSGRLIAMDEFARAILSDPERLRERTVSIPLFSPPESPLNAEELAGAVMCANQIQCRVAFRSGFDPLLLDDRVNDPALN